VHVVPATADRPKTVSEPEQWVARRPAEQKIWPRTLVVGLEEPEPVLSAPNPASFGIENFGTPVIKVALAQTFEQQVVRDGGAPLPPVSLWPDQTAYSVPADAKVLPVPGRQNFRWHRIFRLGGAEKSKLATKKHPPAGAKPKDPASSGTIFGTPPAHRPRFGHQLTVVRPPMNLNSPPSTLSR
jgi:hypothetical protein